MKFKISEADLTASTTTPPFRFVAATAIAATIIVALGAFLGYRFIRVSREAQYNRSAYFLVLDVLPDYLAENHGEWPRSWDDLIRVRNSGVADFRWPMDIREVRKRIRINFDLTTSEVISTGIEQFTAVTQIEPNYGADPWLIDWFLYRARVAAGQVSEPGPGDRRPPTFPTGENPPGGWASGVATH